MKTISKEINGRLLDKVIVADEGKVLSRKHDGFIVGVEYPLGIDYSTGVPREDLPEYYEEVEIPAETGN